jgi:hypothetical protein
VGKLTRRALEAQFLECGDLRHGFARVRCPKCGEELFSSCGARRSSRCCWPRARSAAGWRLPGYARPYQTPRLRTG